jgi:imidazolonepropionase-like amidohydrolase
MTKPAGESFFGVGPRFWKQRRCSMNFCRTTIIVLAISVDCTNAYGLSTADKKEVAYVGATVFEGTGAASRPDMVIVTRADRIAAILPASEYRINNSTEVVSLHGKVVIPGLINSHVHLATLAKPSAAKAYLRRELYSGVTVVRDMAGDARLLGELKREAEFDEIPSPDIDYAAVMAGPAFFADPRTHQAARGRVAGEVPWMQAVTTETNMPLAIAQAHGTGATAIKVYADVSAALLNVITAEAHRQNMLVWAHAAVFPARPSEVADAGVDVMSHACMLGYEVSDPIPPAAMHPPVPVDAKKLELPNARLAALLSDMKQRGTILDATLYVYFSDDSGVDCKYALTAKLAGEAYRAGIPISAGTDDEPGDSSDNYSALSQEIILLVDGAGLTPVDAIRAATRNGARTIGREKDMGSIEVGKMANFVILDKDPMSDIRNIRSVYMTVKNGIGYKRSHYRPTAISLDRP